jgi:hypothetical protein
MVTTMATSTLSPTTSPRQSRGAAAVLVGACDGYARGTAGRITGRHQGCLVFTPDAPEQVASWARPRRRLLVPPGFVAALGGPV